ncbi:MAG: hypothetical protein WAO02_08795 [Verrucomicrobiia bacterium]
MPSQTTTPASETRVKKNFPTRCGWQSAAIAGKVDVRPNTAKITP